MRAAARAANVWPSEPGAALVPRATTTILAVACPATAVGRPWRALDSDGVTRLLAAPVLAKTTHFSLHATVRDALVQPLSTAGAPNPERSVDKQGSAVTYRLGLMIPKRHARRAVTRNLVKRQARAVLSRCWPLWPGHELLIRQRVTFDTRQFPSAGSESLGAAVRSELEQLLDRALRRS